MFLPVIESFTKWLFWPRFRLTLHMCTAAQVLLYRRESWCLIPSHTCLGSQRGGEMWIAAEIGGRDGILEFFEKKKREGSTWRNVIWFMEYRDVVRSLWCRWKDTGRIKRRWRGHQYCCSIFRDRTFKKIKKRKLGELKETFWWLKLRPARPWPLAGKLTP